MKTVEILDKEKATVFTNFHKNTTKTGDKCELSFLRNAFAFDVSCFSEILAKRFFKIAGSDGPSLSHGSNEQP